ncbi:MAG: plasmid pRiA4b ORF-3 family protein [Dysgonamonadaceae bacterium]|jgi:hypothetical protein|nr:plasmid pRiA4b ORF-3 family protein [Dysgonamonadaceae bacterium]
MLYRFVIISDEKDEFRRDILIDSEATFFELHDAILDSVSYEKDQVTSFFICNEDWEKETEITLVEMDTNSDEDSYVMNTTRLNELLDEEGMRLIYVFEPVTERVFFIELKEIITGKTQEKPECIKSTGTPPAQITDFNEIDTGTLGATNAEINSIFDEEEASLDEYDDFEDLHEDNQFEEY